MPTKAIDNKPRFTVVFGDIHGSTYWKKAVDENPGCRHIFLGDYLDPYEDVAPEKLIVNLKEIMQLKKDRHDEVILLLGNHDLHYLHLDIEPFCRFDEVIAEAAHDLFVENRHLFVFAFQEDNHIFSHAGISKKWFFDDFGGNANKNIAKQLNNPYSDQLPALYRYGASRGGDRNAVGGIFWADIGELYFDILQNYTQIVGHNRVGNIREHTDNDGKIIFCDCLYNQIYLKLEF